MSLIDRAFIERFIAHLNTKDIKDFLRYPEYRKSVLIEIVSRLFPKSLEYQQFSQNLNNINLELATNKIGPNTQEAIIDTNPVSFHIVSFPNGSVSPCFHLNFNNPELNKPSINQKALSRLTDDSKYVAFSGPTVSLSDDEEPYFNNGLIVIEKGEKIIINEIPDHKGKIVFRNGEIVILSPSQKAGATKDTSIIFGTPIYGEIPYKSSMISYEDAALLALKLLKQAGYLNTTGYRFGFLGKKNDGDLLYTRVSHGYLSLDEHQQLNIFRRLKNDNLTREIDNISPQLLRSLTEYIILAHKLGITNFVSLEQQGVSKHSIFVPELNTDKTSITNIDQLLHYFFFLVPS